MIRLTRHCLNLCSRAQVRKRGAYQEQYRRIMPALLPAAEMLLRDIMDARLTHWNQVKGGLAPRGVVLKARSTVTQDTQMCMEELLSPIE